MEPTTSSDRPLNLVGQLLLALVFGIGVAVILAGGLYLGAVFGVITGVDVMNNTPTRPIGMAPDLEPLVKGVLQFGVSAITGAVVGLLFGVAAMTAVCRWLLAPLMRQASAFRE